MNKKNEAPYITEDRLPSVYRPLTMWQYFFLSILYTIPIVGLVFLIVHAINDEKNINRRNYARSYFITTIVFFAFIVILIMTGILAGIFNNLRH